jgi:adenylate cyclase class 2
MKKEIEVKAEVGDLNIVKIELEKIGCVFGDPIVQEDTIFVNFDTDFTKFMTDTNFLRIRKTKDKIFFTLKRPQSNELDSIEVETEISDADQMVEAIVHLGYHEAVKVCKTRTKTIYNDMEICLDEVREIGSFIEVEKITDGDGEEVQDELFNFLETLGIKREDRVVNGYDTLVYLKKNNRII